MPGIALVALVAFLIGQRATGVARTTATDPASPGPFAAGNTPLGAAPDISAMSPEERATRLFDRVMRYGEEGKLDSARIFAPMAIQAYEMMGAPTAHSRYDIGTIAIVSGDATTASAHADTILRAQPKHLLGLLLAMKAAGLRNDTAARSAFERRFLAAEPAERARGPKEYSDHAADIDGALKRSATAKP